MRGRTPQNTLAFQVVAGMRDDQTALNHPAAPFQQPGYPRVFRLLRRLLHDGGEWQHGAAQPDAGAAWRHHAGRLLAAIHLAARRLPEIGRIARSQSVGRLLAT